ncbi:hypothetical protein [Phaeodactylibacter xiamenensis]|uniref:hypothetical protein n=1 Tax=Phaeodactylibacter xiamenensis TaxID=1524460 RepID=UPI003BAC542C
MSNEVQNNICRSQTIERLSDRLLAGVMIYGLVKNGFGLVYTAIPLLIIAVIMKSGQSIQARLNVVRAEMAGRDGG